MLNDPNNIKLDAEVNLGLTDEGLVVIENTNGSAAMKLKPELAAALAARLIQYAKEGTKLSAAKHHPAFSRFTQ